MVGLAAVAGARLAVCSAPDRLVEELSIGWPVADPRAGPTGFREASLHDVTFHSASLR